MLPNPSKATKRAGGAVRVGLGAGEKLLLVLAVCVFFAFAYYSVFGGFPLTAVSSLQQQQQQAPPPLPRGGTANGEPQTSVSQTAALIAENDLLRRQLEAYKEHKEFKVLPPVATALAVPPGKASSLPFTFHIAVLAYNRPQPLLRALQSLKDAYYDGDPVSLHIYIDHFPSTVDAGKVDDELDKHDKIKEIALKFEWPHGSKVVTARTQNAGTQGAWLQSWMPLKDNDYCWIVEDDMEMSKYYYQYLKKALLYYRHGDIANRFPPSVYGISLQRQYLVPGKGAKTRTPSVANGGKPFLYQEVGTWGQLLFPEQWRAFVKFYNYRKYKNIKPHLSGMITDDWYRTLGEKIWSPYHQVWAHETKSFNLYTNFVEKVGLSDSHQNKGVTAQSDLGSTTPLIKEMKAEYWDLLPVDQLQRFDFCFNVVSPGQEPNSSGTVKC